MPIQPQTSGPKAIVVLDSTEFICWSAPLPEDKVRRDSSLDALKFKTGTYLDLLVELARRGVIKVILPETVILEVADMFADGISISKRFEGVCNSKFNESKRKSRQRFCVNVIDGQYPNIRVAEAESGTEYGDFVGAYHTVVTCKKGRGQNINEKSIRNDIRLLHEKKTENNQYDMGELHAIDAIQKEIKEQITNHTNVPIIFCTNDGGAIDRLKNCVKDDYWYKLKVLRGYGLLKALDHRNQHDKTALNLLGLEAPAIELYQHLVNSSGKTLFTTISGAHTYDTPIAEGYGGGIPFSHAVSLEFIRLLEEEERVRQAELRDVRGGSTAKSRSAMFSEKFGDYASKFRTPPNNPNGNGAGGGLGT